MLGESLINMLYCDDSFGFRFHSPVNMALGAYRSIVPIVVTCATAEDANLVSGLRAIFDRCDDAHSIAYAIDRSSLDLCKYEIYAIRAGIETGVWIGFPWWVNCFIPCNLCLHLCLPRRKDLVRFITLPPRKKGDKDTYTPVWERFDDVLPALIYMLSKPESNLPLIPAGSRVPTPPPPTPAPARTSASASVSSTALAPPRQVAKTASSDLTSGHAGTGKGASPVQSVSASAERSDGTVKKSSAAVEVDSRGVTTCKSSFAYVHLFCLASALQTVLLDFSCNSCTVVCCSRCSNLQSGGIMASTAFRLKPSYDAHRIFQHWRLLVSTWISLLWSFSTSASLFFPFRRCNGRSDTGPAACLRSPSARGPMRSSSTVGRPAKTSFVFFEPAFMRPLGMYLVPISRALRVGRFMSVIVCGT